MLFVVFVCLLASFAAAGDPITVAFPGNFLPTFPPGNPYHTQAIVDNETFFGVSAAFLEANAEGGVYGRPLHLSKLETWGGHGTKRALWEPAFDAFFLHNVSNITALVCAGPIISLNLARRTQAVGMPMVGGQSLDVEDFRNSTTRHHMLHLRASVESEMHHLLHYAVHGLFLKRFLIFYMPAFGTPTIAAVMAETVVSMGLPRPVTVETVLSAAGAAHDAWRATLEAILDGLAEVPHGVFIMTGSATALDVVERYSKTRHFLQGNMYFFGPTFTLVPRFGDSTGSAAVFQNYFVSQAFPAADDTRYLSVRRFQAAAAALRASDPAVTAPAGWTESALYGYIVGRVVASTLRGMDQRNVTGAAFIRRFYQQRFVFVDDLVYGPYTDRCVGIQTTASQPCWCNTGNKVQHVLSVNASTGFVWRVPDALATAEIPLDKCGFTSVALPAPLLVPALFDAAAAGGHNETAAAEVQSLLVSALRANLEAERQQGRMNKGLVHSLVWRNPNTTAPAVDAMLDRFQLFLAVFPVSRDAQPRPLLTLAPLPASLRFLDRDPDTVTAAAFDPHRIHLFPTIVDFVATAAAYAASKGAAGSVGLVVEEAGLSVWAVRAVTTFGHRPLRTVTVGGDIAQDLAAAAVAARVVIVAAHTLPVPQLFAAAATHPSTVFVLCLSELRLLHGVLPVPPPNLLMASGLPAAASLPGDVVEAYGHVVSRIVMGIYSLETPLDAPTVADTLLKLGGVSHSGAVLSKLSSASCGLRAPVFPHPGGACQCTKGLHTFHLFNHSASSAARATFTPSFAEAAFRFEHQGCGVAFVPLPDSASSLPTAALVGIAVGGVLLLALIAGAVLLALRRAPGRDLRHAPRDPSVPFAIVFTDIQASTALWALAPEQMGTGLDLHHSTIRRVISDFRGYEVKTIGDSFMVAFKSATDATACAVEIQRALHRVPWDSSVFDDVYGRLVGEAYPQLLHDLCCDDTSRWHGIRVRAGVHCGTGRVQFDSVTRAFDYYGTVVNTAARVEAVGHGGQVLVTSAVLDALQEGGWGTVGPVVPTPLGEHHLRGLSAPTALTQLLPEGLAHRRFPPLRLDYSGSLVNDTASSTETSQQQVEERRSSRMSDSSSTRPDNAASVARVLVRRCGEKISLDQVLQVDRALATLTAPLPTSKREVMLRSWAEAWRLPRLRGGAATQFALVVPTEVLRVRIATRLVESMAAFEQLTGEAATAVERCKPKGLDGVSTDVAHRRSEPAPMHDGSGPALPGSAVS